MSNKSEQLLPLHGGDIVSASMGYNIPVDQWIDLSTGINPEHYPVDSVGIDDYCRLPYISHHFNAAAKSYYLPDHQKSSLLAVAGTQVAIQTLPRLLAKHPVLIPDIGYQEHRSHWQKNQSTIINYPAESLPVATEFIDTSIEKNKRQHLVIINPNNPSGIIFNKLQLIEWAKKLDHSAYVIIDEAFIDSTPENSVLTESLPENIIVLRSFGKFFGLAGIRLGFVLACPPFIQSLQETIGIWQVNGPAQALAIAALSDTIWHSEMIERIKANALHTQQCCTPLHLFSKKISHSDLFSSYFLTMEQALVINQKLAEQGILTRVIPLPKITNVHNKNTGDKSSSKNNHAILRIGRLSKNNIVGSQRLSHQLKRILDSIEAIKCSPTPHKKVIA